MLDETPAQLVAQLAHPEWLVARYRAAAAGAEAGQVGGAGAAADGADRPATCSARIHALWTLEGLGALDAGAGARADEGSESADAHPGDSRQRDAVQGRRARRCSTTTRRREGSRHRRGDPGDADAEPVQGAGPAAIVKATQAANQARGVQLIGTKILQPPVALTGGGAAGAGLTARAAGGAASSGATDLQRAVLHLSRPGRPRHPRRGPAAR